MDKIIYICLMFFAKAVSNAQIKHDYIVLGAGPAGLQLGYFLERAGRDYIILERSNVSGSFFEKYPRHDTLISINKRNTGQKNKEFNMRHDWNSLLSHDETLQMRHYSKKMFPPRESMLSYLSDFQNKLNISVQYNTEISNIEENQLDKSVSMTDQHGNVYKCSTLVIATGLWKPNRPTFPGEEYTVGYEDVSTKAEDFEEKSVLILGNGNSAFEVADRIFGSTNVIHIMGRSRIALSWETHYVGDLRAINNGLLDTYQLKSLDGVLEGGVELIGLKKDDSDKKLYVYIPKNKITKANQTFTSDFTKPDLIDNFSLRKGYDMVIRALGWKFDASIFKNSSQFLWSKAGTKKYPLLYDDYKAVNFQNVYGAGTLSHSLDFRQSAGGFIHGFRYTARTLHNILEYRNHGVEWPHVTLAFDQLLPKILKRLNEASGLYQMFGVLSDVIILDNNKMMGSYFEEFPVRLLPRFSDYTGFKSDGSSMIVVVFQYGSNYSGPGKDVFHPKRAENSPAEAHLSNFLHPVIYYYKSPITNQQMAERNKDHLLPKPDKLFHLVEDFLTEFDGPVSHILPLRRFLEAITDTDLRYTFAEDCMKIALTYSSVPPGCEDFLHQEQSILGQNLWQESQYLHLAEDVTLNKYGLRPINEITDNPLQCHSTKTKPFRRSAQQDHMVDGIKCC